MRNIHPRRTQDGQLQIAAGIIVLLGLICAPSWTMLGDRFAGSIKGRNASTSGESLHANTARVGSIAQAGVATSMTALRRLGRFSDEASALTALSHLEDGARFEFAIGSKVGPVRFAYSAKQIGAHGSFMPRRTKIASADRLFVGQISRGVDAQSMASPEFTRWLAADLGPDEARRAFELSGITRVPAPEPLAGLSDFQFAALSAHGRARGTWTGPAIDGVPVEFIGDYVVVGDQARGRFQAFATTVHVGEGRHAVSLDAAGTFADEGNTLVMGGLNIQPHGGLEHARPIGLRAVRNLLDELRHELSGLGYSELQINFFRQYSDSDALVGRGSMSTIGLDPGRTSEPVRIKQVAERRSTIRTPLRP